MDREQPPLGRILDEAREALGISGREAARRAGITDTRWRQVVSGVQARGDRVSQARPRPQTVVAMALAVNVDPAKALAAAGMDARPARVAALLAELRRVPNPTGGDQLAAEVERLMNLPGISRDAKLRMVRALVSAWEESPDPSGGSTETALDSDRRAS